MKKTLFAISAIAVLLGFTACTNENEIAEPQVSGKTILKAYTEETTRTALDGDDTNGYDVVWSEGDKIFHDIDGTLYGVLTGGDGTTCGVFEINGTNIDGETFFYGFEANRGDMWQWPNKQTYAGNTISFSPMVGKVSGTGEAASATFKNLGGLLRLNLKGTAKITSVKISANEYLSGQLKVEPSSGDAAVIDNVDTKCFKSITLDCGAGVTLNESTATSFYIAMPANTTGYTGVTIELTDDEGKVCVKKLSSSKNLVINRSQITPASFTASSFKPTITASSPVGTIGLLDGREGIVVDLGGSVGKVVIATMNVGATSVDYATAANNATCYGVQYDAAGANSPTSMGLKDGWRAPTPEELKALFGIEGSWRNADYTNNKAAGYVFTIGANELFLPAAGYNNCRLGECGEYRSQIGTAINPEWGFEEDKSYRAYFWNEGHNASLDGPSDPSNYNSVRPFHAMPTE